MCDLKKKSRRRNQSESSIISNTLTAPLDYSMTAINLDVGLTTAAMNSDSCDIQVLNVFLIHLEVY